MKRKKFVLAASTCLTLFSCQNQASLDQVVSQKYIHKYGFDVSQQEWDERLQEGQVVETLRSGVKITRSYENGQLHGPTTHSFPDSSVIEKLMVYDQGTLLKETIYDQAAIPIREEIYEFDDRNIITTWNDSGIPLSVEEYENDVLVEGQYFTNDHELESKVENGYGTRIKRTREGQLISKDLMKNGQVIERTTYHPNGQMHMVSHYLNSQLHGPQQKYSSLGRLELELTWNHGILDGVKSVYRNGLKVAEIPYENGHKQGIELHYDDLGNLISETTWKNDQKHGCYTSYTEDTTETEWFYKGVAVDAQKFKILEDRERMIAELSLDH